MKKLFNVLKILCIVVLISPLALSWLSPSYFAGFAPQRIVDSGYFTSLVSSFKELSITLAATVLFAMLLSFILGYISVLNMHVGLPKILPYTLPRY